MLQFMMCWVEDYLVFLIFFNDMSAFKLYEEAGHSDSGMRNLKSKYELVRWLIQLYVEEKFLPKHILVYTLI